MSIPPGFHECAANGCRAIVGNHLLMCSPHWRMVPADLQRAVWNAWNRHRRERSYASARAHTDASRAARRAVAELEAAAAAAKVANAEQRELF